MKDFATDLAYGQAVERSFASLYLAAGWEPSTDRRFDFVHTDGRTLELKAERRPWDATKNVFFELTVNGKPGGPWRAREDGVSLYIHYFSTPLPMALVWRDVPALVRWVEKWLAVKPRWVYNIRNKGFTGQGYAVPWREMTGDAAPSVRWL
jgi:hypothetical protein